MSGKITIAVPDIDEPNHDPNNTAPVDVKSMGPAPYGVLCKCSGSVLPTTGMRFLGVYLRVGRGNTVYTKAQVIQYPDAFIPANIIFPPDGTPTGLPGSWSCNAMLNSDCSAGGSKNTLHAVCRQETLAMPPVDASLMTQAVYHGKCVAACS